MVGHKSHGKMPRSVITLTPQRRPTRNLYPISVKAGERLYLSESSPRFYRNKNIPVLPTEEEQKRILQQLPYLNSPKKIIKTVKITKDVVRKWSGKTRKPQQVPVMGGVSPNAYALMHDLPVDQCHDYNWCHEVAHSMGGSDNKNPQVRENLTLGSRACNRQMMPFEGVIKQMLLTGELEYIDLTVEAVLIPAPNTINQWTHIAKSIRYIIRYNSAEYTVEFDAQTSIGVHRDFKKIMKENVKKHLKGGGSKTSKVDDIINAEVSKENVAISNKKEWGDTARTLDFG